MPAEPFHPQTDAIIVHKYRGRDEYARIEDVQNGRFSFSPFASGNDLSPNAFKIRGSNAYDRLLQWAKLSGRLAHEVACSNPVAPKSMPREILRVVFFGNPAKQRVTKRIVLPPEIAAAWGTATDDYLQALIRDYVRTEFEMSHTIWRISKTNLDLLVARRMQIPRGQPFPTNLP